MSRKKVDEVVSAFEEAAEAAYATPTRDGNVIRLTHRDAEDVLVTADLHGDRERFERVCELADLEARPRRHLLLQEVCHGGPMYPSGRGCMSHLMLEDVARLKVRYPDRVHFIMSNHELAELTDYPIFKGGRMLNLLFRTGMQEKYGGATERVREAYLTFLRSLPLAMYVEGGAFVAHSIPELVDKRGFDVSLLKRKLIDDDLWEGSDVFRLVWGRDYRPENADAFARAIGADVLVTGHEPCPDGYRTPNARQVIIDSCCQHPCYAVLPVRKNGRLTYDEVLGRVERLDPES